MRHAAQEHQQAVLAVQAAHEDAHRAADQLAAMRSAVEEVCSPAIHPCPTLCHFYPIAGGARILGVRRPPSPPPRCPWLPSALTPKCKRPSTVPRGVRQAQRAVSEVQRTAAGDAALLRAQAGAAQELHARRLTTAAARCARRCTAHPQRPPPTNKPGFAVKRPAAADV